MGGAEDPALALTSPADAFDEQIVQLPLASANHVCRSTTPSDEKDDFVLALDVSPRLSDAPEGQSTQFHAKGPSHDRARPTTPPKEDDHERTPNSSHQLADIIDKLPGGSRAVVEGGLASLRTALFLVEEDIRRALYGMQARGLGDGSSGLVQQDDHSQALALVEQGMSSLKRYENSGALAELVEGMNAFSNANGFIPETHPMKLVCLTTIGTCFLRRFERLGDIADVDEAIKVEQQAVRLTPDGHPHKPVCLNNLGISFQRRYEHLGSVADVDEAVTVKQQAVRLTPDGHPDKPVYLSTLGRSFQHRFERLGFTADLDEAITTQQRAVHLTLDGHPDKPGCLCSLGVSFQSRFNHLGDIAYLDKAIRVKQQATILTPDGHPDKPARLNNLGNSFRSRFKRVGDIADLSEAIIAQQQAGRLTPDNHPSKPACLNNLGISIQRRFERLGNIADLDEAITVKQQGIRLTPDGHPHKPVYLNNLGVSFQNRFEHLGDITNLNEAITMKQQAVHLTPDSHPHKPGYLNNLGASFQSRFERLGDIADLDEAITAQQQAVHLTPDGHPHKPACLNNLGNCFQSRFERLGDIGNLDGAITVKQQAARLAPDHPDQPMYLNNLGVSFRSRFERLGDMADLDEAVTAQQLAIRLTPDGHPDKPRYFVSLGASFLRRFERFGNIADLDKAITTQQQAVSLTPDGHPDKPGYFNDLGISFQSRFERLGDITDLHEATSAGERAVALTPDDHPGKPAYLSNLGISLQSRFERLGDVADLDEAIAVKQQAVRLIPDGHPDKSSSLNNLGTSFRTRFKSQSDRATLAQAISIFSQSAMSSSGPPSDRFTGAQMWASLCVSAHSDETLDAYATLISLIPRVVWLGQTVEQRYQGISNIGSAVAEAAAAAIHLGELNSALEWLEQGRSIVWGQILQLRTPLTNLRQHHPHEADQLEKVSRALESAGTARGPNISSPLSVDVSQTPEELAQAHRRLATEYEGLVEHIRGLPDFSDFLLPQKSASLCSAATSGPVVVVNTHEGCCDALILVPNASQVSHVALPGLQESDMSKMHSRLAGLTRGIHMAARACGPYEPGVLPRWDDEMPDILGLLWLHIAEPVLRYLKVKLLQKPAAGKMPHITWCLTGRLTFFPIHAAGLYGEKGQAKIFDYVVSSYTFTLTALLGAQRLPIQRGGSPRVLAVSQPEVPMQKPLPGTTREVNAIQALQCETSRLHVTALNGAEATVEAVLLGMKSCNWIHLACHGIQDPSRPTNSAFLINGQLTLNEIMKQSFTHTDLAFLSACQTAKGDSELPEEAIHLAASMMMAGYRGVIGTMWSIRDDDAPIIAEKFYTYLIGEAGGDSTKAAYALHNALGHLRDSNDGHNFARWVPFIHLGVCSPSESSTSI